MWSDNDIDNAFQRLNPPEQEHTPFPLDAWLRLENQLDKAVIERAVRRRLWKFFAAEVAVVLLVALGWLAWPTSSVTKAGSAPLLTATAAASPSARIAATVNASGQAAANTSENSRTATTVTSTQIAAATTKPTTAAASAAQAAAPTSEATTTETTSSLKAAQPVTIPSAQPISVATPTRSMQLSLLAGAPAGQSRRHRSTAPLEAANTAVPQISHSSDSEAGMNGRSGLAVASRSTRSTNIKAESQTFSMAHGSAQHLAAGSIAAPTEVPTRAVVAAASRLRQHREGQSPLSARRPATSSISVRAAASATSESGLNTGSATPTTGTSVAATVAATAAATAADLAALTPTNSNLLLPNVAGLPAPLATVAQAPPSLPVRQPRLYVGLVGAPDVSTVRFASVESPMPNVGVVLEYRLTNRLRVSTGVLRSTKKYMARRDDYDWGAYSNQVYAHDFADVDGTCTVLDIPLNLRYDFLVQPQYRVFGSAGLSSFFMQREHYYYDWTDYSGFHAWNGYAVNQNRHLFSILNLSLGFERSLGNHWSVQAEPYAKLPLGGVGLGKVRLASGGVFFGVKYGF